MSLMHLLPFCVHACRSTILQQQFNRVGRAEHGSVALPGVIRSGSIGTESLSMGTMPSPQQQITMGQMHRGHMPPLVRAAEWLSVSLLSVSSFSSLIIERLSPVSLLPTVLVYLNNTIHICRWLFSLSKVSLNSQC